MNSIQAQMVRRVKSYLSKMNIVTDEDQLMKLSLEAEPAPSANQSARSLSAQPSSSSIGSKASSSKQQPQRGQSPSPSVGSTASSTSHHSEGRRSNASTANSHTVTKFGKEWVIRTPF